MEKAKQLKSPVGRLVMSVTGDLGMINCISNGMGEPGFYESSGPYQIYIVEWLYDNSQHEFGFRTHYSENEIKIMLKLLSKYKKNIRL